MPATSKFDHDAMRRVLSLLASGYSFAAAARKVKISPRTIFRWAHRSRHGEEATIMEWDGDVLQYVQHQDNAVAMAKLHLASEALQSATQGFQEQVTFGGEECWRKDPRMIGLTDEECIAKFGTKDRYLRDSEGKAIVLTVRRKPSDALVVKHLTAYFSQFADIKTVDLNVQGFLRLPRPGDSEKEPKMIEQKTPEVFQIEPPVPEAELAPQIALGRPANDSAEFDKWVSDTKLEAAEFVHSDGRVETIDPVKALAEAKPVNTLPPDAVAVSEPVSRPAEAPPATVGPAPLPQAVIDRLADNPNDPPGVRELKRLARMAPKNPTPNAPVKVIQAGDPEIKDTHPAANSPAARGVRPGGARVV